MRLDTTNILGRGAVRDTYNLLGRRVKLLLQVEGIVVGNFDTARRDRDTIDTWERCVKGEAAIDWSDKRAPDGAAGRDCGRLGPAAGVVAQAQGEHGEQR